MISSVISAIKLSRDFAPSSPAKRLLTDHMMLQATELGLGSVWICYFKPDVIRREFGLPENLEPVNILAVGYSDEEAADPERHSEMRIPINQLVSYENL